MKNIAHIGLGYWGKNILRNLYELEVIHTACDLNFEIINQRKSQYPDINYTTNYNEILQNPEIKAVVISTPAVTHYEFAKLALMNDKDVFVEKPLSLKVKDAQELIKLAKERDKILMVGHILHYHPAVKKLKEMIKKGEIGKVQYIYSNRLNIGKIRTEENILWSFAPHDISLIIDIVKEEPVKIIATGGDYITNGIYDVTLMSMEFRNQIKSHIFVSWLHPFKEQKLIIVGSKGMIVFDDVSKEKLFLYRHKIEWENGKIPVAQKADYEIIPFEEGEPLKLELLHFIDCVKKRKKPYTDGEEGLRVLKILNFAEECIVSGKINLKLEEKRYFVHESSYIDENVEIGKGTKIWHFSHILSGSKIGANCIIGQNCMIGPDVKIGNRCKIQNNVSIYKGVELEDEVFCGPSCVFTNVINPRAFVERKDEFRKTLVKKGATIGANATIICGVTIGKYSMIGGGAVVTKDVPDFALVVGSPAIQIGWVCKCGEILINKNEIKGKLLKKDDDIKKILCNRCKRIYILKENRFYLINKDSSHCLE